MRHGLPADPGARLRGSVAGTIELLRAVAYAWSVAQWPSPDPDQARQALERLTRASDALPWGGTLSEVAFGVCAYRGRILLLAVFAGLALIDPR